MNAANIQRLYRTCSMLQLQSYCVSKSSTTSPLTLRIDLHWLPVQQRIEYKVGCVLVFKCLHQAAPTCLAELCIPVSESTNRGHFRSAARGDLVVPRSRTIIDFPFPADLQLFACILSLKLFRPVISFPSYALSTG